MSRYRRFKERLYSVVGTDKHSKRGSYIFDIALCSLVLLSCVGVVIELFPIGDGLLRALEIFEYVTVGIFIFEYLLRLWLCDLEYRECKTKGEALWEYITSFDSLVDIISIASVLFNAIPKELYFLRMLKLIKLVRLAKMSDYIKTSGKLRDLLKRAQVRTNEIIDKGTDGDIPSKIYDICSVVLIILSVGFILVETFPIPSGLSRVIYIFEIVVAVIFAIEYVLRVWTAPLDMPSLRPDKARMKYIFSFMSLVDILSIVPVFVASMSTATGILKIFKLCKIIRLLKASRYLNSIASFGKAIQKKKKQIVMSLVAIVIMIMICSVLMYSFEGKEQPEVFKNGFSGVYYCVQIMLDADAEIAPVTQIGQLLSTLILLLGGCMFGVPVAIVATGFENMIAEQSGENEDSEIYEVLRAYDSLSSEDKRRFGAIISAENEKNE